MGRIWKGEEARSVSGKNISQTKLPKLSDL